jgi:hypothetical protein
MKNSGRDRERRKGGGAASEPMEDGDSKKSEPDFSGENRPEKMF